MRGSRSDGDDAPGTLSGEEEAKTHFTANLTLQMAFQFDAPLHFRCVAYDCEQPLTDSERRYELLIPLRRCRASQENSRPCSPVHTLDRSCGVPNGSTSTDRGA